jgi:hypothetical protein
MNSDDASQFKSVNDVGLESEYEVSEMMDFNKEGQRAEGYSQEEEEEKVPNISKTRINDASGIQFTNSNYDQASLEEDNIDYNDLTKGMED